MPIVTQSSGPFKGVRTTNDPGDDSPHTLHRLVNGWIPDPTAGSVVQARPGFAMPTFLTGANAPGQEVFSITLEGGTSYNFLFGNGKVFRMSTDLTTLPTDVTPTNVTIDTTRFIYCVALGDNLIVSDGTTKPWVGSNLSSTPITATNIEWYDAATLLSRGSTDTAVASIAFDYQLGLTQYSKAGVPAGTALASGTIPLNTWGIYKFSVNSSGTITSTAGSANFTTGYATEAAAIAALPATPANQWNMGYVTVQTKTGSTFVGGTDALEGGSSGNVSNDTNYYAGEADPWAAFGSPTVYGGCLMFIADNISTTASRTWIGWSEPNQPTVGYQQTDYDNAWTLTQTDSDPLYAIVGTNAGLFYARAYSWGKLVGQPSLNFENNATNDAISTNIGTVSPKAVRVFGNYVYFLDAVGRPYRFAFGDAPEPLWLQLRSEYDAHVVAGNAVLSNVANYAWGVVEPNLNLYITGCWPLAATSPYSPTTLYVFDANSGVYEGTWTVGGDRYMDVGGLLTDANGQKNLMLIGRQAGTTTDGYLWKLAKVSDGVYQDNSTNITVAAQSPRLGYHAKYESVVEEVRAVSGQDTPCTGSLLTTNGLYSLSAQSPAGVTLLSRGTTDTAVASAAFDYVLDYTAYSKAAVAAGTALAAGTIPSNKWGVYRFSINSAGTVTVTAGAANFSTGYSTEALAIAALPTLPASSWNMGYITVQTKTGTTFVGGTDGLYGGTSGNVANATNYYPGETSFDGTQRILFKTDNVRGRGVYLTVSPTTTLGPWTLLGMEVDLVVPSKSAADSR